MKQPILRYLALRVPGSNPDVLLRIDEDFLQTLDATQRLVDAARASTEKPPSLMRTAGADDVAVSVPLVAGYVGVSKQPVHSNRLLPMDEAAGHSELWWASCVNDVWCANPHLTVTSRGAFLSNSQGGDVGLAWTSADLRPFVAQALLEHRDEAVSYKGALVSPQEAARLIEALRLRDLQVERVEWLDDPGGPAAYEEAKHNADVAAALVRHLVYPAAKTEDDDL